MSKLLIPDTPQNRKAAQALEEARRQQAIMDQTALLWFLLGIMEEHGEQYMSNTWNVRRVWDGACRLLGLPPQEVLDQFRRDLANMPGMKDDS